MKNNCIVSIKNLALATAALATTFLCAISAQGQAFNFTAGNLTYSENFDSMGPTGTAYINGWTAVRGGGSGTAGATLTLAATDGNTTTGNAYNVGTASASDRAFGTLASGSTVPYLGAYFTNSTGGTITNIVFGGTNEQWKSGSSSTVNEVIAFEYSLDATALTNGTWTALSAMNLNEILTSTTVSAAVDGNAVANKAPISGTVGSLVWPNNSTLWIRWKDADNTGSDGMYAVDDFSMTVAFQPAGAPPSVTDIQPSSITTNAGSTVAFTVSYTGDSPVFRWYKETASTTNLIFTGSPTLTLSGVLAADTANYQVILSNATAKATSAVVSLTVIDPALISSPSNQTNLLNSSTVLSVGVQGTSLTYQWYRGVPDGVNTLVTDTSRIAGSQSNILTITNLVYSDADNYFAIVTNVYGAVTSSVAAVTITNAGVLAYWDFNALGLTGTNPAPTYGPIGASTTVANTTNAFLFATTGNNDPIASVLGATNYAWGSSTYPFNGNVANNKTTGLGFKASTVGLRNLSVSYDSRASATGSRFERLQYTTNGTDYVDFPGSTDLNPAAQSTVVWRSETFSLVGFPGVRNNPNFGIRVVAEFESTAKYGMTNDDLFIGYSSNYATNGTLSKDIVTINAESITNASTPPTITTLLDRTNVYDSAFTVNFTVGDAETAAANLTVTAKSFNQSVVTDGNIVPGGSGASRNIQITPSAIGKAPILVTVTDTDGDSTATWFMLTTIPSDFPPTTSSLSYTNTLINTAITIPFTISDDHASASTLYASLSGTSGNQTLVPNANISFGGSGNNPTIIINPAAGQVGIAPITVSVNDGVNPATTTSFNLMVRTNTSVVFNDSFDYDTSGNVTSVSLGLWQAHSGANNGPIQVGSGKITVNGSNVEDINAPLLGAPYTTNSSAVLYSSFKVNFSALPTLAGTYFAHFKDDGTFGFMGRVYASTLNAAAGSYRLGIGNGSGVTNSTAQFPLDLSVGTSYTVITKLDVSNAVATIWINPTSISDTHITDSTVLDPTNHFSIYTYAFRQSSGEGTMTVDDLKVGTSFTAVTGLASGPAPSPTIQSISIQGGNIIISGTNNNTSGSQTYYILSSTNLTLPLAQWTSIETNTFNSSGNFSSTNAMGANAQQFYLLQVP